LKPKNLKNTKNKNLMGFLGRLFGKEKTDAAKKQLKLGILFYDLEKAEQEYREAIKINPNNADAHNNLGALLEKFRKI
jgi:Flp pilus assembly protein TadD